jgi:O-antigen/teichoic acid export membrane protein
VRLVLGRNVIASVVNAAATLASSLVTVPLILEEVGVAGYGVWTLAITIVVYVSIVETGIGPAVQRFVAVARGRGAATELSRLLWSSLLVYAGLGLLSVMALQVLADPIVRLFDVPVGLQTDAEAMFQVVGIAVALALMVAGTGNVLMGLERFPRLALASGIGAFAFVGGVVLLVRVRDDGLTGLAWALVAQQAVVLGLRLWFLRDVLRGGASLVRGTELRVLASFSLRLQATVFTELINWQSDKIVVGLVAPAATLGQLGIGAQAADAGRLVAGATLSPIISTLAVTVGTGDPSTLIRRFHALNRLWLSGVLGATAIGAASLHAVIAAWLGEGYGLAALLGAFLVLGSGCGLATGVGVAYKRAIGQPGLEARYGFLILALNAALTIPLAIAVGAVGVVVGTFVAYLVGMAYFLARLNTEISLLPGMTYLEGARSGALALVAAVLAAGFGEAMVALLPTGFALLPVAAGVLVAFSAYLLATLRVWPSRAAVGRMLDSLRPGPGAA